MAREPKFGGTIFYSKEPIAGITLYQGSRPEQSLEEMFTELEKADLREARKLELLNRLKARALKAEKERLDAQKALAPSDEGKISSSKRYLVDPETGKIDVVDEDGEYTYKDALLVSASIKGRAGHYDDALKLIEAFKALVNVGSPKAEERKKEFYVEPETGVIVKDPENGEYTLAEARTISQSMRKAANLPPANYYVDPDGNVHQLQPGQPVVVKQRTEPSAQKIFLIDQKGNLQESEAGKPIVVRVESTPSSNIPPMYPFPAMGADNKPILGSDGKPVYVDIEPMLKWLGFQSEQKRADERHNALMGLTQTIKENLPIGMEAFSRAASEVKGKTPESTTQQYECGSCHTKFTLPREPGEDEKVICPKCGQEWTGKEVLGA